MNLSSSIRNPAVLALMLLHAAPAPTLVSAKVSLLIFVVISYVSSAVGMPPLSLFALQ
jgi:hypothetical protein